jgi:hypothetical protein
VRDCTLCNTKHLDYSVACQPHLKLYACVQSSLVSGLSRNGDLGVGMPTAIPALEQSIDFVLREGETEIPCRISLEALGRQAGAGALSRERAERLLQWYRQEIERVAFARYAAGDFSDGVVMIDIDDIGTPPRTR